VITGNYRSIGWIIDFSRFSIILSTMGLLFSYWWILLPAIIFGFIAQMMVRNTYKSQSRIKTHKNITGRRMAAWILKQNGLDDVKIRQIRGRLSDHYDPPGEGTKALYECA
jgi:Zn-dependent membrane protease YugP